MIDRARVEALLGEKLASEHVRERQGGGGKTLSYVEGIYVIRRLNHIFGYGGWRDSVVEMTQVADDAKGKPQFRAIVELVVAGLGPDGRDWMVSDVGFGSGDHEKGPKEAVTDALKRCARRLGDSLGGSLYEKPDEDGNRSGVAAPEPKKRPSARAKKEDAAVPEIELVLAEIQGASDAASMEAIKQRIVAMKAEIGVEQYAGMVDAWKAKMKFRQSAETGA